MTNSSSLFRRLVRILNENRDDRALVESRLDIDDLYYAVASAIRQNPNEASEELEDWADSYTLWKASKK